MKSHHITGCVAAVVIALSAAAAHATTPSHLYTLDGTLADTFGGPALTANGGTLSGTGYSFATDQGLDLAGALPLDTYTIDMSFSLDVTSGYRKLIDFKNLASDSGFYVLSTALNFYPIGSGPAAQITDATTTRVTLSRDGSTTQVQGYVNGVLAFAFDDTGGLATFSAGSTLGHFFIDDLPTGQREASGGFVDYIAVYDTALPAVEIATLTPTAAVPEPTTGALLTAGLGVLGWVARRRR